MSLKCNLGIHDWKKDCENCSVCGKTRSEVHDWSKDCENCRKCGKTRDGIHTFSGCKCSQCGTSKHDFKDYSCSRCGQPNFPEMLSTMYGIGRRCNIIGYIGGSEEQYIADFNKQNNETERVSALGRKHLYLTGVIKEMFNPPITYWEIDELNNIARAIDKASTLKK